MSLESNKEAANFLFIAITSDKPEMKHLRTPHGKAFVNYLTDNFEKLNLLKKPLQGSNKTLVDAKTKICYSY